MNRAVLTSYLDRKWAGKSHETLVHVCYLSGLTGMLLRLRMKQRRCTILLYHQVDTPTGIGFGSGKDSYVPPGVFRRQMEFLKGRFRILSLREAISHVETETPFPPASTAVTFDDGYRNNFSNAYPILTEYAIPFSLFVSTGFLGNQSCPWWEQIRQALVLNSQSVTLNVDSRQREYDLASDMGKRKLNAEMRQHILMHPDDEGNVLQHLQNQLSHWPGSEQGDIFLSREELRRLAQSRLVEIGSHSISHASLTHLDHEALRREVQGSKDVLESDLGRPVESFAYPYGERADFSPEVIRMVKDSGYRCALTGLQGNVGHSDDPFQLKRISIGGRDDWPLFLGKLAGISEFLRSMGKAVYRRHQR